MLKYSLSPREIPRAKLKGFPKGLGYISRCIRPPQSQSGTNNLLKTSVCADGSQHLHETNRINSCYSKSLRIFFEDIFIFLWLFRVFSGLKTLFLDFLLEKLSLNAEVKTSYCVQLPSLTQPNKFDYKNLEMIKNTFSIYVDKKNIYIYIYIYIF